MYNDYQMLLLSTFANLPFRVSAEDLEIPHTRKKKNIPPNGSIGESTDIILQHENGVLRGRSFPTLLDVPLHLDVDAVCAPESGTDAIVWKDEEKKLVKVVIE